MFGRYVRALGALVHADRQQDVRLSPAITLPPEAWSLKALRNGWSTGQGPDYVGVGVPKAGTSWWHQLIIEHPAVVPNRADMKELHYFCHYAQGLQTDGRRPYQTLFSHPTGKLCGEWSPSYLHYPLAIEGLRDAAPDARILVLLRDPVQRLRSHSNQIEKVRARYLTEDAEKQAVFRIFSVFPEVVAASLYATSIQRLLAFYPRHQVLVLQYERCAIDPAGEVARTYAFLGLDSGYSPPSLNRVVNRLDRDRSELPMAYLDRLAAAFAPDLRQLAQLCPELDLGLWPTFQRVLALESQ